MEDFERIPFTRRKQMPIKSIMFFFIVMIVLSIGVGVN